MIHARSKRAGSASLASASGPVRVTHPLCGLTLFGFCLTLLGPSLTLLTRKLTLLGEMAQDRVSRVNTPSGSALEAGLDSPGWGLRLNSAATRPTMVS